jgi:hypothetical protein
VGEFRGDKIGNAWLRNPKLLKPSHHIDALKLRTYTYGTRVVLDRISPINTMCRGCGMQRETLGHISGKYNHTKNKRIRRHDEIKHFIAERLPQRFSTFIETAVKVDGDLRKPDLVIKDQDRLMVVDVTVRYENSTSQAHAHTEKARKYMQTAENIKQKLACSKAEFLSIDVGCRGVKPRSTVEHLSKHDIRGKDLITISMSALRFSIEMANAFIDYVRIV